MEEYLYVEPEVNVTDSFQTTLSDEQRLVEMMCIDEISGSFLFEAKDIDAGSLELMWAYTALICVVLRVLAVGVIVMKQFRWISWMRKRIRQTLCRAKGRR